MADRVIGALVLTGAISVFVFAVLRDLVDHPGAIGVLFAGCRAVVGYLVVASVARDRLA